jgi:hypothetical protein
MADSKRRGLAIECDMVVLSLIPSLYACSDTGTEYPLFTLATWSGPFRPEQGQPRGAIPAWLARQTNTMFFARLPTCSQLAEPDMKRPVPGRCWRVKNNENNSFLLRKKAHDTRALETGPYPDRQSGKFARS